MPQIPLILDTNDTERSRANSLLRDLGIGQAEMAARLANRGDVSAQLTGTSLGAGGAVAVNTMVENEASLPKYTQPGVSNPPAVPSAPAPHLDAMQVSTKPSNYVQPNVITPAARAGTSPTVKNPMGL